MPRDSKSDWSPQSRVAELLSRLEPVAKTSSGWMVSCPAHEDAKPSLSIDVDDGQILVHCFAGCTTCEVMSAINLPMSHLMRPGRHQGRRSKLIAATPARSWSAVEEGTQYLPERLGGKLSAFGYHDADDTLVGRALRLGKSGGSLHRLDASAMATPGLIARPKPRLPQAEIEAKASRAYYSLTNDGRDWLANDLGCTTNALDQLGVGRDSKSRAFTFPMFDAQMRIVGIRLRAVTGKKWAVKGGREGMFLAPRLWTGKGPVLLPEGASDAAALVEHFDVAGRPSCSGAVEMTVDLCSGRVCAIVADSDLPGQHGAFVLAAALRKHSSDVFVMSPPVGHNDVRAWFAAGGTIEDVRNLMARRGKPMRRSSPLPVHLSADDAEELAVRQYHEDEVALMTWEAMN